MAVGVLALQGAFLEHERMLNSLGAQTVELRGAQDLSRKFDRLVLPGGESTVQARLLREQGMLGPLRERILDGMPVLATCAGLILLACEVEGGSPCLGVLGAQVRRNAFGRQLGSFRVTGEVDGVGRQVPMTFIRAPYVERVAAYGTVPAAKPIARVRGRIVGVRQGRVIALAFHPELDEDERIHSMFLSL